MAVKETVIVVVVVVVVDVRGDTSTGSCRPDELEAAALAAERAAIELSPKPNCCERAVASTDAARLLVARGSFST